MRVAAAVLLAVGGAAVSACLVVRTLYLLHMLQLEEYSVRAFTRWAVGHVQRLVANLGGPLAIAGLLALVVRPDSVPSLCRWKYRRAPGNRGLSWNGASRAAHLPRNRW